MKKQKEEEKKKTAKVVKAEKEKKIVKKESKKKPVNKEENKKALKKMTEISKNKKEKAPKKPRIYKEPNVSETETTINVLYWKDIVSVYTNNVDLQKKLRKVLGKPTIEDMRGRSIVASRWDIPMKEKTKLSQMILKANLFEL